VASVISTNLPFWNAVALKGLIEVLIRDMMVFFRWEDYSLLRANVAAQLVHRNDIFPVSENPIKL
jgi:lysylphosphatidylglycerol synthetase-like protein (DUF2156 family)